MSIYDHIWLAACVAMIAVLVRQGVGIFKERRRLVRLQAMVDEGRRFMEKAMIAYERGHDDEFLRWCDRVEEIHEHLDKELDIKR